MLTGILGYTQREAGSSDTTEHTIAAHCTYKGAKRLKLTHKGAEDEDFTKGDLISGLPDEILTSILSLLSMKDGVKTSILSGRWRFLWATRTNLEFDLHTLLGRTIPEGSIQNEDGLALINSEYVRRVGIFLDLYRAPKIYSFKLSYCIDQTSACHLDRWIKFVIARGVELLEINLSAKPYLKCGYVSWYKPYNFPCSLLLLDEKTPSLKHLHLDFSVLVCPPNFNGFNTLVTLELYEVKLNENCLDSFFSSCLHLEKLNMTRCTLPPNLKAVGSSVNLICLEVLGCLGVKEILISAAKLTSFKHCGRVAKISLCNVPRLERLFIHHLSPKPIPCVVTQLPKDLPGLRCLFLSLTIEVPTKLASYSGLKELELQVSRRANLLWLISTINVLPLLLKLNLKLQLVDRYKDYNDLSTFGCPHNCLKEIEIFGYNPSTHMELVIYLLKNCVALERMIIDISTASYCGEGDFYLSEYYKVEGEDDLVSLWKPAGGKEKFYQVLSSEVPGRGELVTIRN